MDFSIDEGVEEHCSRGLPVASGSADFLVVLFDAAGEGSVDYSADVGFVDAHAEGDCGYDYFQFSRENLAALVP